jgi:hypothetical protein
VSREIGCRSDIFTVGDSFTEAEPHQVTNVGDAPAVLRITQLFPASVAVTDLRIEESAPTCPGS